MAHFAISALWYSSWQRILHVSESLEMAATYCWIHCFKSMMLAVYAMYTLVFRKPHRKKIHCCKISWARRPVVRKHTACCSWLILINSYIPTIHSRTDQCATWTKFWWAHCTYSDNAKCCSCVSTGSYLLLWSQVAVFLSCPVFQQWICAVGLPQDQSAWEIYLSEFTSIQKPSLMTVAMCDGLSARWNASMQKWQKLSPGKGLFQMQIIAFNSPLTYECVLC
jgi:hypothetical protein